MFQSFLGVTVAWTMARSPEEFLVPIISLEQSIDQLRICDLSCPGQFAECFGKCVPRY